MAPVSGSWSLTGVSSVWITWDWSTRLSMAWQIGARSSQQRPIQAQVVCRESVTPVAEEDPFLPIQGQMIGILADDDLGQQPRAGQALRDRLGQPLGDR